jgi:hypothetical protein
MKFWYVTVMKGYTTVFQRKCLTVGEANDLLKEKKKEYPAPDYMVTKENF